MNPFHIFKPIYLRPTLMSFSFLCPGIPRYPSSHSNSVFIYRISHTRRTACLCNPQRITNQSKNIQRRVEITTFFIIWFTVRLWKSSIGRELLNPLTPNDDYSGRTAPLTSKHCILYIYSTNTGTEYFKHGIYSRFALQNAVCFIILTYLVLYYSHFIYRVC